MRFVEEVFIVANLPILLVQTDSPNRFILRCIVNRYKKKIPRHRLASRAVRHSPYNGAHDPFGARRRRTRAVDHADAFEQDVVSHPHDDAPRLIYADWLQDQGARPAARARAELIRGDAGLAALAASPLYGGILG
jgi:uncharacterized protein (TIGR02996 family)